MRTKSTVFALLALALLAMAIGLTSRAPSTDADLVVINRGGVTLLDPQRMSYMSEIRVGLMLYECLVRHDTLTAGFDIIPGVAESWDVSADGLTYTFRLRDNAQWSNGDPVTSADFYYAWRRGILPDLGGDYQKLFLLIDGAQDFSDWRLEQLGAMARGDSSFTDGDELWEATVARFAETVAIRTPDEQTFEVTLKRPVPYFLDLAAFVVFSPVHAATVGRYETIDFASGRLEQRLGWTKPEVLIANGPFLLDRWRFKRDMFFIANERWWDRDSLAVETVLIPEIEDPSAAVLAFETGVADWLTDVVAPFRGDMVAAKLDYLDQHRETVDRLLAEGADQFTIDRALPPDPRLGIHSIPAFGSYFWNFNCLPTLPDGRENPFADQRVRQAFGMVIDRTAIARDVRRIGEPAATTLIPPGSIGGYTAPEGVPLFELMNEADQAQTVARARALLAEAGYPDPAEMPVIELLFNKDGGHDLIAQSIAQDWQKYLGVRVRLEQKELKIYRADLKSGDYMTSRAGWFGDYGDPTTFLDINRTGNGNNDRKFSQPEYDGLLDAAELATDPEERLALLAEAERRLVTEWVPLTPIFHYANIYLFDPHELSGVTPHPRTKQYIHMFDILGDGMGSDVARELVP
ncbi:MAG: peptide ABC transporter substrate-binding protein [Planctomycetota bacterium]